MRILFLICLVIYFTGCSSAPVATDYRVSPEYLMAVSQSYAKGYEAGAREGSEEATDDAIKIVQEEIIEQVPPEMARQLIRGQLQGMGFDADSDELACMSKPAAMVALGSAYTEGFEIFSYCQMMLNSRRNNGGK